MLSLRQVVDWLSGHDSYELRDRVIHRKLALFREQLLPIDEIENWTLTPEMGFDVVEIHRTDGTTLVWFDYRNDLIATLRALPTT